MKYLKTAITSISIFFYTNAYAYMWDRNEEDDFRYKTDFEKSIEGVFLFLITIFITWAITKAVYRSYKKLGPVFGCIIFGGLSVLSLKNGSISFGLTMACFFVYSILILNENRTNNKDDVEK